MFFQRVKLITLFEIHARRSVLYHAQVDAKIMLKYTQLISHFESVLMLELKSFPYIMRDFWLIEIEYIKFTLSSLHISTSWCQCDAE